MVKFEDLGISEGILNIIRSRGFDKPTEVQAESIPLVLTGEDVIAGSKTGSGKTLAFACGIIERAVRGEGVQAIVLTPTRELAEQVTDEIKLYAEYKHLKVTPIYGGVGINPQIHDLRTTDVVVGTPGRVLDHLSRETLDLNKVKIAVLDEADRMLDMGFIEDVERILGECPKERQTLLYSATISDTLVRLADQYMWEPRRVSVESYVDPKNLNQIYYNVQRNEKFSLLVHLLKQQESSLVMVFCNTKHVTDFVAKNLKKHGFNARAIHGGLSQAKRSNTLDSFHDGTAEILVCTDVAARGLHIDDVSHVYNYDIPNESKQYVHRIGRTARAGHKGVAINLLSQEDFDNFNHVLDDNMVEIRRVETPQFEKVRVMRFDSEGSRGNSRFAGRGVSRGGGYRGSDRGDSRRPSRGSSRSDGRSRSSSSFSSGRPRRSYSNGSRREGDRSSNRSERSGNRSGNQSSQSRTRKPYNRSSSNRSSGNRTRTDGQSRSYNNN